LGSCTFTERNVPSSSPILSVHVPVVNATAVEVPGFGYPRFVERLKMFCLSVA
jgi:hypothetical protein